MIFLFSTGGSKGLSCKPSTLNVNNLTIAKIFFPCRGPFLGIERMMKMLNRTDIRSLDIFIDFFPCGTVFITAIVPWNLQRVWGHRQWVWDHIFTVIALADQGTRLLSISVIFNMYTTKCRLQRANLENYPLAILLTTIGYFAEIVALEFIS